MYTLYGEPLQDSPFVFTAFVALKEKGVPFVMKLLDLKDGAQRASGYVSLSLTARVPALEVAGFSLSESLAIVEYLEETLPPPERPRILPLDSHERARARQLMGWLRTDLAALRRERPSSSIFYEHVRSPLGDTARADADKLVRIASSLLDGRPSLFGGFSIADAELAFALQRLVANGDALPAPLATYATTQWQRPSVAAWAALERPSSRTELGPL